MNVRDLIERLGQLPGDIPILFPTDDDFYPDAVDLHGFQYSPGANELILREPE